MPRNIWPELQALTTLPPDTSTSILRCPSILVIGSIVILLAICVLHSGSIGNLCKSGYEDLDFLIKRGELIPEARFTAADAGMASFDRPAGTVIELCNGAIVVGFRSAAADRVEAIAQSRFFGTEFFNKLLVFKM